jgi:hypothetical protein
MNGNFLFTSRNTTSGNTASTLAASSLSSLRKSSQTLLASPNPHMDKMTSSSYGMPFNNSALAASMTVEEHLKSPSYIKPKLYQAVTRDGVVYEWEYLGIYDDTDLVDVS